MTRTDREALKRAIALAKAEDEGRCVQIEAMLAEDGFQYAGTFAAYCCQCRSLRLKPWQIPPCHAKLALREVLGEPALRVPSE